MAVSIQKFMVDDISHVLFSCELNPFAVSESAKTEVNSGIQKYE